MTNRKDIDIEIRTKTETASRIALSFMMTTAIFIIGNFIAAASFVYILNFWRPETSQLKTMGETNSSVNANTIQDQSFTTEE